jgi:hypothetical protein
VKCLIFIPAFLFMPFNRNLEFINPTGTYILKGLVEKNLITGHNGEIRVKLLQNNTLALCFYMNNGYPSFQSGAFKDTLAYDDNQAKYIPANDSSCTITFLFNGTSVQLALIYTNPHCTCGFAQGVIRPAVFEKSSGDNPIIQDLSSHRIN